MQTAEVEPAASNKSLWRLFLVSFSILALEVLLIRWVSTEIRAFAYFKNIVLMACFLGMGIGCATNTKQPKAGSGLFSFPILLLIIVVIISTATQTDISNISFLVTSDAYDFNVVVSSVERLALNALVFAGIFVLIVATFDQLGRLLSAELAEHDPLPAYNANIAGSLAGVAAFFLVSFLQLGPAIWLAAVLLPLLAVYWNNKKALAVFSGCGVASLVAVFLCTQNSIWSPYQRIDTAPSYHWEIGDKQIMRPYPVGTQILVNHNPHQRMIDLSDKFLSEHPEQQTGNEVRYFNIPYIVGKQAHDVLILGAGTGNDVSAAVRHGATHIDAVEIDPALQALGKLTHPEHPYQSPAVNVHIDDARAFLGRTQNKYDTIVLGMLDSQTALSTMSSVRLDNYLYTVDCLRSLTQHLTPDGVAFVSFATQSDWLRSRFYQMIKTASGGQEPVALKVRVACPGSITVAWGPGLPGVKAQIEKQFPEMIAPPSTLMTSVELPTDDWPFIYQQYRSLPLVSVFMLISVLGISALMITGRFKLRPQEFVGNLQFFLLGAGFLLMETRAMLAGALLLGSTWTINTAIIALVLIMALIANAIVIRAKWVTVNHAYGALIAALLVMYFFDLHMMTQWALPAKLLGGALVLGTPFLCSGIVFARAFKNTTQPNVALGINVLGAIVGGLLEYSSVVVGSNNLVLLAIALYVAAFLSAKNPSKV